MRPLSLQMMEFRKVSTGIVVAALVIATGFAAEPASSPDASLPTALASQSIIPSVQSGAGNSNGFREGSKVGVAFKVSTLGLGGEVAGEVTRHLNLRGGVNGFGYSRGYDNNGIHYAGDLKLLSGEAHLDYFPLAGAFHLSPGLLVYNDDRVTATASAPGGGTLTLNSVSYLSDPANPISGNARLDFRKVAPTFLIGFGNLVPRHRKHFSVNLEGGVAYEGPPRVSLALAGSACDPTGLNCRDIMSDPTIQSNVLGEQTKISHDLSPLRFYPLLSLSFGYRF